MSTPIDIRTLDVVPSYVESESGEFMGKQPLPEATDVVATRADLESSYYLHRDEIIRFLRRTFGEGPPDPEDVVQSVFERFAKLGDQEKVHNVRAFLFRSAQNYVFDERRRQSIRAEYVSATLATAELSDDLNAERVIESRQSWTAIETAISQLDARSREMLLMNRIHGLSYAEIARRHACSATLVKAIVARALVNCHRALSPHD